VGKCTWKDFCKKGGEVGIAGEFQDNKVHSRGGAVRKTKRSQRFRLETDTRAIILQIDRFPMTQDWSKKRKVKTIVIGSVYTQKGFRKRGVQPEDLIGVIVVGPIGT